MYPDFPLSQLSTKLDGMFNIMDIHRATDFGVFPVLPSTHDGISEIVVFFFEALSGGLSSLYIIVSILVAGVPCCLSEVFLADYMTVFKINRFRWPRFSSRMS